MGIRVDRFDEAVNIRIGNQTLEGAIQLVRTNVDDADSIVSIQNGHGVIRTHVDPVLKSIDAARED